MAKAEPRQGQKDGAGEFSRSDSKNEGFPLVIIDTSVAIKWFFPEEDSESAKKLLAREDLGAPDLLLYEFSNVITGKPYLSLHDIQSFMEMLYQYPIQFFVLPQKGFLRGMELARKFGLTTYDANFLALAETLNVDFVTADQKLARKVKGLDFVKELQMY